MTTLGHTLNTIEDPDKIQQMAKISSAISKMPAEITERFKALKVIADDCQDYEEEKETEMHNMVITFENLYGDIYRQRNDVINGLDKINKRLVEEFDEKAKAAMEDPAYKDHEINPVDVNQIKNIEGVPNYW
jgi:hypothetical protein